jgi:hypothetical protein
MRQTLLRLGALVLLLVSSSAAAEAPKGYECDFEAGTIRTYTNGAFTTKPAQKLSFAIGDINMRAQTASLITPKGTGDLRIVRAIGATHFLEVVTEGFLNITTIYETANGQGPFPAVHSRHFGLLGTPVVSQYHGMCRAK